MKKINLLLALVAIIVVQAFVAGCQPSEPPATTPPGDTNVGKPEDSKGSEATTATPPTTP
jgi:hypothetical protein